MSRTIEVLPESKLANIYNRVGEGQMAETYVTAIVWSDGTIRRSFLKLFPKERWLGPLNEITGYLLASACSLPLPSHAGILKLPPNAVEWQDNYLPYAFVVSEAPGKTPTTLLRITDEVTREHIEVILRLLKEWPKLNHTVAFDDWVANVDRNLQNILIDGPGKIVLIDHSNMPIDIVWHAAQLNPAGAYRNILATLLKIGQNGTLPQKREIAVAANDHLTAYNKVVTELHFWWDQILGNDPSRRKALEEFIRIRAQDGYDRISATYYLMAI